MISPTTQQPAFSKEKSNVDKWYRRRAQRAYGMNQRCCCCIQILAGIIGLLVLGIVIAVPVLISLESSSSATESASATSAGIAINVSSAPVVNSTTAMTTITSNSTSTGITAIPMNSTAALNTSTVTTSTTTTTTTTSTTTSTVSACLGPRLITFDDIVNATKSNAAMPSLYNCFNWVNGWYLNTSTISLTSGYRQALSSGSFIALNRNGTLMNITTTTSSFNMYSFVGSSGFANPLHLSLQGIRGSGTIAYNRDVLVYDTNATIVSLNWMNLTRVTIGSYYYDTANFMNYTGLGYQFSIDNLNVTLD